MLVLRSVSMYSLTAMIIAGASVVSGQDYPIKPIRIVVGGVGGSTDIESRLIAQGISGPLGQSVIVDNRAGLAAVEAVSKAPPDGYTLHVSGSNFWTAPLLEKMPYDPVKEFLPITIVSRDATILTVHPSLPVKSARELIALAKAKPGELNYGSGSTGSATHLSAELFKSVAGVNIVRITYKSGGPAMIDLLGGHVHLMFATSPTVAPYLKSGRVRALAVTGAQPSALFPELPTVAASGLPGYDFVGLGAVFAPAKTPGAIINRLNQEIVRYLRTSDAKEKFLAAGMETVVSSPEELATAMKLDIVKWTKVIKDAGLKAD